MLLNDIASAWDKAASRHDTPHQIQVCWQTAERIRRVAKRLEVSSPRLQHIVAAEVWRQTPTPEIPAYVANNIATWLHNERPQEETPWVLTVVRHQGLDSALFAQNPLTMVDQMLWARLWGTQDTLIGGGIANKLLCSVEEILFPRVQERHSTADSGVRPRPTGTWPGIGQGERQWQDGLTKVG